MNDVTYLEAAREMAERMMREGGTHAGGADRVRLSSWRRRAARAARERKFCWRASATIATHSRAIRRPRPKYLAQGEAPRDAKLDARELAAYATVASMILNLDAAVTKE